MRAPGLTTAAARAAVVVLSLAPAVGVAVAHAGSGSPESQQHLVADVFGFLALAFVAYISVAFARRVVYPRVRDALSR